MSQPDRGTRPAPGDTVVVEWGLEEIEAVVEAVHSRHVLVKVPVIGPRGESLAEQTVSVPLGAIRGNRV